MSPSCYSAGAAEVEKFEVYFKHFVNHMMLILNIVSFEKKFKKKKNLF